MDIWLYPESGFVLFVQVYSWKKGTADVLLLVKKTLLLARTQGNISSDSRFPEQKERKQTTDLNKYPFTREAEHSRALLPQRLPFP